MYTQIISIVAYVLCVVLFAVALYFRVRGNVVGAVSELIAMAEEMDVAGHEKMAYVVSKLYERVPGAFKGILTEEVLEDIAQWIFDWMRKYAVLYVESHGEPEAPVIEGTNQELLKDLINRLSSMSVSALREFAEKIGVSVAGLNDEDVLKAIVFSLLVKNEES